MAGPDRPIPADRAVREPARDIPVIDDVDVVVCGGGVAGCPAALAAAAEGARVMVVEHMGFLGGVPTASHVNGIGGWQFDLDGSPLIDGLPLEIMQRVAEADGANLEQVRRLRTPVDRPDYTDGGLGCYWLRTHPEKHKLVLDRLLRSAGVRVLLHCSAVLPIMEDGRVTGVFVESKSGRQAVLARVVIDCTGDADIAARAGVRFHMGRPQDGACQPMTAMYTCGNSQTPRLWYGTPDQDPEPDPLLRNRMAGAIRMARERGEFTRNPNDIFCAATPLDHRDTETRSVNFTRVQGLSSIDVDQLTQAEMEGREQVNEAIGFMRAYMPGCENAYLIGTPPYIGVRESRRIEGEYALTGDDVRSGADFADGVARGIYLLDIHNPTEVGVPSTLTLLEQPYTIPWRALVPKAVDGLLVAGRCISGDHIAMASYRVQSHCMATGQAAGTAAALAARAGVAPRMLDVDRLRDVLRAQGANPGGNHA